LDNANKYSPDNPDITVSTRNVGNGVEVVIKDCGIGMSKEARKHIFDKFYRVHTGNLHDVKGFGLGLSYVKAIMTAHKGQIDVKSELGKGSSFILHFPFRVDPSNN
jgi:two-component system phosphate regulon sensor histidine kinase PhoR